METSELVDTITSTAASRHPGSGVATSTAVEVRGLRRTYGHGDDAYEAVRGVDLDVAEGSVTALLGTNGAGKTSTLEVIEGLAPATAGAVTVLGLDPIADRATVRRRTGVLLQRSGFSGDLTVRETLRQWHATVTDPRPVDDMLAALDLEGRADVRVLALSGGETRRVDLACTLMGRPELAILDEPTTGLDPESRRGVWQLVNDLRDGGATVLVTTHYLEEAEALADRLEIMHGGRIVRSGTPTEIAEGYPSTISFATVADLPGDLAGVRRVAHEHGRTTLETEALQRSLTDLLAWAGREDVDLDDLDAHSASLETVFLSIADGRDVTGRSASPAPAHDEGASR
jgi:ABC-2 type transport system ATP-binding protein